MAHFVFSYARNATRRVGYLFIVTVILPFVVAIMYFGVFASDVYISNSQFVVRSPEKQAPSGLGILLSSTGVGSAGDENLIAQQFLKSRDALRDLNHDGSVEKLYNSSNISIFNRFNPLGLEGSFEDLYDYYLGHTQIEAEASSSITSLSVRAYKPEDARWINERLLELSENLVNRLNERARADMIEYAQNEVDEAETRVASASLKLAQFRDSNGIIDPEKQTEVQLQMISKLQDELISTKAQLTELRAFTPKNPQIPVLKVRVGELTSEIEVQLSKVAGDNRSISSLAGQYQRLQLENQLADRQLAAAILSLNEAKNDARRKQVYVERIAQPSLSDEPREPRRLRGILATLVLGLVAWGVLSLLLAGVREHKD